jgi:hypothetical protein
MISSDGYYSCELPNKKKNENVIKKQTNNMFLNFSYSAAQKK